jgi:hypothetical protein
MSHGLVSSSHRLIKDLLDDNSYLKINSQEFSQKFPSNYVDHNYGKDFRKCRIKFVEAHTFLMKHQLFQIKIHVGIKNRLEAETLCNFYQVLANKEKQDLYCYVEYNSIIEPIEVKKYTVYMCNFKNESSIRTDIMYNMIKQRLDNKPCIVLLESMDRAFLIKVAHLVLKDFLKPFQLCVQQRYFTAYGPEHTFNVLYIDTERKLESSDFY